MLIHPLRFNQHERCVYLYDNLQLFKSTHLSLKSIIILVPWGSETFLSLFSLLINNWYNQLVSVDTPFWFLVFILTSFTAWLHTNVFFRNPIELFVFFLGDNNKPPYRIINSLFHRLSQLLGHKKSEYFYGAIITLLFIIGNNVYIHCLTHNSHQIFNFKWRVSLHFSHPIM